MCVLPLLPTLLALAAVAGPVVVLVTCIRANKASTTTPGMPCVRADRADTALPLVKTKNAIDIHFYALSTIRYSPPIRCTPALATFINLVFLSTQATLRLVAAMLGLGLLERAIARDVPSAAGNLLKRNHQDRELAVCVTGDFTHRSP